MLESFINKVSGPGSTGRAAHALAGLALAIVVAWLGAPPALAEDRTLGAYKSWLAQSFTEGERTVCMMWSQPEKDEGDYERRGEIFVFITHRPGDGAFDRVSFEMGYDVKAGTAAAVTIKNRKFRLRSDGSTAWSEAPEDDRRLVEAMRAGREMVVESVSHRGTRTRDTYSLYGFSAAHDAIDDACRP